MTTEQVIAYAKEKLGKDITKQEAQDYLDKKAVIPDEALDTVSGGAIYTAGGVCKVCGQPFFEGYGRLYCNNSNCAVYRKM